MNLDSYWKEDDKAVVQKKKKYAMFTVKEIGGPAEILIWRAEQLRKERENLAARAAMQNRVSTEMFGKDAPQGDSVTATVHGTTSGKGSWNDKLAEAMLARERLATPEVIAEWHYESQPKPKIPFLKRVANFFTSFWKNANF